MASEAFTLVSLLTSPFRPALCANGLSLLDCIKNYDTLSVQPDLRVRVTSNAKQGTLRYHFEPGP